MSDVTQPCDLHELTGWLGRGGVLLMSDDVQAHRQGRYCPAHGVPLTACGCPIAPETDHVVCCDPNRALCGANVAGQGVAFGNPEHSRTLCRICANKDADGERCGAKDCPGPERQG